MRQGLRVGPDHIKFLPGETTKVVYVQILDCPLVEGLETFTLDLFNNTKLAKGSTLVTIVDRTVALNKIEVTPANPTAAKGTSKQFSATGTYSNNVSLDLTSTVVWSSSTPTVATVGAGLFDSGGLAQAVSQGTTDHGNVGASAAARFLSPSGLRCWPASRSLRRTRPSSPRRTSSSPRPALHRQHDHGSHRRGDLVLRDADRRHDRRRRVAHAVGSGTSLISASSVG